MSRGNAVRARKRQKDAQITPFWFNRSRMRGNDSQASGSDCKPITNTASVNPERTVYVRGEEVAPTVTRQQIRIELQKMAEAAIVKQYGDHSEGFGRKVRRSVVATVVKNWYAELADKARQPNGSLERARGYIVHLMRGLPRFTLEGKAAKAGA